ncbi:MAG: T9SS type A sorting domain-containing protein, partial [Candidatus Azobacteroides sp.]|nr:T9SS type A sorting domain-containing protein [Candidatus Azobacteroides sp.]
AFIVEAQSPFTSLVANPGDMTSARADEILRTGQREDTSQLLTLEVHRGKQVNKTLVVYSPQGQDPYRESIPKTFLRHRNEAVNIYTLSPEGVPLDLNYLTSLEGITIPLGIRTSVQGPLRINVSGLTGFAPEYDIFLCDRQDPLFCQNLRKGSMASFEKTSQEVFDNRFELRFVKKGTSLPEGMQAETPLKVYSQQGKIYISTTDASLLQRVNIYDLNGREITATPHVNAPCMEVEVPRESIYLVRVVTQNGVYTAKILAK